MWGAVVWVLFLWPWDYSGFSRPVSIPAASNTHALTHQWLGRRFVRPGLAQSVLDLIEVKELTPEELDGQELACAICLSDFEVKSALNPQLRTTL